MLSAFNEDKTYVTVDNRVIAQLVEDAKQRGSGTMFAVCNSENLKKYNLGEMRRDLFRPQLNTPNNALVISVKNCDGNGIKRVVYLDKPFGNVANVLGASEYVVCDLPAFKYQSLSTERSTFTEIFKILKYNRFYGKSSVDVALNIGDERFSKKQIIFSLEVFIELGIFAFAQGSLQFNQSVKSDLAKSKIYNAVVNYFNS